MSKEINERLDTFETKLDNKLDRMEAMIAQLIGMVADVKEEQSEIKQYIEEEKAWREYTETRLKRLK